jgi:hypothetical protein
LNADSDPKHSSGVFRDYSDYVYMFVFLYRKRIRQNLSNIDFDEDSDSDEDWNARQIPLCSLFKKFEQTFDTQNIYFLYVAPPYFLKSASETVANYS